MTYKKMFRDKGLRSALSPSRSLSSRFSVSTHLPEGKDIPAGGEPINIKIIFVACENPSSCVLVDKFAVVTNRTPYWSWVRALFGLGHPALVRRPPRDYEAITRDRETIGLPSQTIDRQEARQQSAPFA